MLEIKNICFSVEENGEKKKILKNINLTLNDKNIHVITGPNGSGKSTLAKIIMGILTPTSGQILFDGKDITSLSINERAALGMTYAFQQPVVFKGIKVKDVLDIASGKNNTLAQNCDYLAQVGLCARNYIDRNIDAKLSGGELKRIELATVLARKGKVNLFDEPEAGIDLWSFENLTNIFSSLKNSTNIIVSHQKKILEIADNIIMLENGEVVRQGKAKQILAHLNKGRCGKLRCKDE